MHSLHSFDNVSWKLLPPLTRLLFMFETSDRRVGRIYMATLFRAKPSRVSLTSSSHVSHRTTNFIPWELAPRFSPTGVRTKPIWDSFDSSRAWWPALLMTTLNYSEEPMAKSCLWKKNRFFDEYNLLPFSGRWNSRQYLKQMFYIRFLSIHTTSLRNEYFLYVACDATTAILWY